MRLEKLNHLLQNHPTKNNNCQDSVSYRYTINRKDINDNKYTKNCYQMFCLQTGFLRFLGLNMFRCVQPRERQTKHVSFFSVFFAFYCDKKLFCAVKNEKQIIGYDWKKKLKFNKIFVGFVDFYIKQKLFVISKLDFIVEFLNGFTTVKSL